MENQENNAMIIDANLCLILAQKYRGALQFAERHIKAAKPWDEECKKVIGEALRPKPPKGFAEGGQNS